MRLANGLYPNQNNVTAINSKDVSLLFQEELLKRSERVKEVCRNHQEDLKWSGKYIKSGLFWSIKHKIAYCPIAKVKVIIKIKDITM